MNKNIDLLPFQSLITDFKDYVSEKEIKAKKVFDKCIAAGRYKVAIRIADKYGLNYSKNKYDLIVSAGLAMMARKK